MRIKSLIGNIIVHLGALGWLRKSYFGDISLMCLVNPAKVVSVPKFFGLL